MSEKVDLDSLQARLSRSPGDPLLYVQRSKLRALIAELRAARAMVPAAKRYLMMTAHSHEASEAALRAAINDYDRLTGERQ